VELSDCRTLIGSHSLPVKRNQRQLKTTLGLTAVSRRSSSLQTAIAARQHIHPRQVWTWRVLSVIINDQLTATEWCDAGVVICLGRGADLHMVHLMPLPITFSCSNKSRLVLPSWSYLSGTGSPGSPGSSRTKSREPLNGCSFSWLIVLLKRRYISTRPVCVRRAGLIV